MNKVSDLKNLTSLGLIQGGNALIHLILFPQLFSKLGSEQFSILAKLDASSVILLTFCLYSFEISGLKIIAESNRKGNSDVKNSYYAILYARLIIFIICSILFILISIYIFNCSLLDSTVWTLFPLGLILQSSYYYQSKNNNFPLAILVIAPKLLSCLIFFGFMDGNINLTQASILITTSYLSSGIASFIYIYSSLGFCTPNKVIHRSIILILQEKTFFLGNISVLLYRGSNTLLLSGLGASSVEISTYAVAEKYIKVLQALAFPLTQIYAAKTVKIFTASNRNLNILSTLWNNTKFQILISTMTCIIFILLFNTLNSYLLTQIPEKSFTLLTIMMPAVIIGTANYSYGTIAYSALGLGKQYAAIVLITGLLSISTNYILIKYFDSNGAAVGYFIAEFFLLIGFATTLKKNI